MRVIVFTVFVLLATLSNAQNLSGVYTYESINGIKTEVAQENVLNVSAQSSLIHYNSFADLLAAEKSSKKSFKKSHAKNAVVINKTKKELLVRFNGRYASLQLVDSSGKKVTGMYSTKLEGLVVPRFHDGKQVFLKAEKKSGEVIYKRVIL